MKRYETKNPAKILSFYRSSEHDRGSFAVPLATVACCCCCCGTIDLLSQSDEGITVSPDSKKLIKFRTDRIGSLVS